MDRIEGTEKKVSSALSIKISSQMESNFIHSFIHSFILNCLRPPVFQALSKVLYK